ncbi:MAG TPA: DegT/DnrJ/EryC1/StrS family aminotransferase [Desulfobacterales bacterium]|nr:DegT/DnrJ/EryC1/StrS family aminotransferase [Desulfobacterales bacterium]
MMIPIVKPTLMNWDAVIRDFRQAWESGQVTTGQFTRRLEAEVERQLEIPHVIMMQSCTAGLMLVLRALEVEGEAIMPAFTWTATAHAAVWNNLTPVFADISPGAYTLDPEKAVQAITPRTSVLMPVNVFGCPPDYEAFAEIAREHGVHLVYDSAQGLGSRYLDRNGVWRYAGSFGEAEIFSMSPTKVISAMEGGLVTTSNAELAQTLRQMRDYGKTPDAEDIAWLGLSARVPEVDAIVAYYNFAHRKHLISRRQELMQIYREGLKGLKGVRFQETPEGYQSSGNYFTIFIDGQEAKHSRDEMYQYLKEHQIQAKKYFFPALHLQKVYQTMGQFYRGKLPVTEAAAASGLALPLFSHMTQAMVFEVIKISRAILE